MSKEMIESLTDSLENMGDKIQELKTSDPLQAQVMYEKYKKLGKELESELPPPIPESFIVEDQAVS